MATTWTQETIASLLQNNNAAVERAIVAIYNRQTEDEKQTYQTRHSNGVGFSGNHSIRGTYYAKWIISGKRLTGDHLVKARAMALRYTRQLLEVAEANSRDTLEDQDERHYHEEMAMEARADMVDWNAPEMKSEFD